MILTDIEQIRTTPPPQAMAVAERVHATFGRLIAALPGQPQRPMDLARAVNADKSVAHRMVAALTRNSGIGTLLTIPGPGPLTEIALAARRLGVDAAICAEALDAAAQFDALVQALAGDRTTFDTMMSEWVDGARAQIDTAARQAIFRGMKHIHGLAAETTYTAFVLHPNADSTERGDYLALDCVVGLHRLRSGGKLTVKTTSDLRGSAALAESTRTLLEEFCSKPTPVFKTTGPANALTCAMEWNGPLGRTNTSDVVLGEVHRKMFTYVRSTPERPVGGIGTCPWVPAKRAVMDLILHKDVFPSCIPGFMVSRTGVHGLPDPNDPARLSDRITMDTQTEVFGVGSVARMPTPGVPFRQRLLETQCAAMGWDLAAFRAFRVCIEYPIFDAQMMFLIALPEPNENSKSG